MHLKTFLIPIFPREMLHIMHTMCSKSVISRKMDFITGLSMMTRGATIDKLRWTFRLYDIDGDGRISRDEMREIINSIYLMLGRYIEPSVDEDTAATHADKVFKRLDLNGDGYVTFDEFLEACQKDENIISSLQLLDTVL